MTPGSILMSYDITQEDLDHFEEYYKGEWVKDFEEEEEEEEEIEENEESRND